MADRSQAVCACRSPEARPRGDSQRDAHGSFFLTFAPISGMGQFFPPFLAWDGVGNGGLHTG